MPRRELTQGRGRSRRDLHRVPWGRIWPLSLAQTLAFPSHRKRDGTPSAPSDLTCVALEPASNTDWVELFVVWGA